MKFEIFENLTSHEKIIIKYLFKNKVIIMFFLKSGNLQGKKLNFYGNPEYQKHQNIRKLKNPNQISCIYTRL